MAKVWQLDNFSLGMHTEPGKQRGGSRYAADKNNLQVDGDGWLRLRSNFKKVGPDGENITGLAASNTHLFILREGGKLYFRPLSDLDDETEITDVPDLEGRISVISAFRDYIMLTSEGEDQGYWVDFREDKDQVANTLGIVAPSSDAFDLQSDVPDDAEPTALVAYFITYIRQFEAGVGEVLPDDLFNGMESEPSEPQYLLTLPLTDEASDDFADTYIASSEAEWTYEATIGNVSDGDVNLQTTVFSVRYIDRNDEDWEDEIRASDPVGKHLRVVNQTHPGRYILGRVTEVTFNPLSASITLADITATMSSGESSDGDIVNVALTDIGSAEDIDPGDYYPATLTDFVDPPDPQVTGINIYRSIFYKKDNEGTDTDFDKLKKLIDDDVANRDFSSLPFRKVYYLSNDDADTVIDGVQVNADGDDEPFTGVNGTKTVYTWTDGLLHIVNNNKRLPTEVKQFELHQNRIWGGAGDRLVYSDLDFGELKLWAFPTRNAIRRSRTGRIDFVAEHREVLLFGGRDGLYRLIGTDASDFNSDEISRTGPVDGYCWSATINALGYVGENGFYLTDAATTEYVSKLAIDKFFENKRARRGAMLFFSDDTFLFTIGLQPVDSDEGITDYLFRYEDGYWSRWSGTDIKQVVAVGADWTRYWLTDGTGELVELEWNEENTDTELEWWWESNWISGRSAGVQNEHKQFRELALSAEAGTDMKLETWVGNDESPVVQEFTSRDDEYFQILPIERIGERLRFRLSGTGQVTIRGIQIEA